MQRIAALVVAAALFLPASAVLAQSSKDPLNEDEIDQIREVADQPVERVKLYMKFIKQRTDAVDALSSDHKSANRPERLRTLLDEFTRLTDELQDNLDTYDTSHSDIRKALKELVPDSAKWSSMMQTIPPDASYDFSRKVAVETAQSVADQARKLLEEQNAYFATHKPPKDDDHGDK